MKYDFGGYATKNNIKCSDGRTIKPDAFKHNDGITVPLVWQHQHHTPANVLGHAVLENREDGVYAYCSFNETEAGQHAKGLVSHGDIKALSIYANELVEKSKSVLHGFIREVSLVLSGANPGALIDNVVIAHADGSQMEDETEAVITMGENIELDGELEHAAGDDKTIKAVYETMNEDQKNVVHAMIAQVLEEDANKDDKKDGKDDDTKGDSKGDDDLEHNNLGGKVMKNNLFNKDQKGKDMNGNNPVTLKHSDIRVIAADAIKMNSLEGALLKHAGNYGIDNIEVLFPDAQTIRKHPDWVKRDTGWVGGWMSGTHHTPFSRIKSRYADITPDEARAKGYIKGDEKDEEVFALLGRETYPTTVYKKQKLDRDDILDITSFDVIAWIKAEMRLMLDEEVARAGLVGDGRSISDKNKIKEDKIRPIYGDAELYAHKVLLAATKTPAEEIEELIRNRKFYKGTGKPNLYVTADKVADWLLIKDGMQRRIYKNIDEIKSVLRVKEIHEVEVMENISRVDGADTIDLIGIMVNPSDYSYGADRGGKVTFFDGFDLDFNQEKYLLETRTSGALTLPKSALVIEKTRAAG